MVACDFAVLFDTFYRFVHVHYMLSSVRLAVRLSVCRLSVTLVHPTEPVEIFDNVSTAFWYLGHPLTSTENFTILRRSS